MSPSTPRGPLTMAISRATPSLALIKYWGKSDSHNNLPATPSIAVTLDTLASLTRVFALDTSRLGTTIADSVVLDGRAQDPGRFADFFDGLRSVFGSQYAFWAESSNNFPTAAGLASSSSGFAALTLAAAAATGNSASEPLILSSLARRGSGSAARSLFGGFTLLPENSESAEVLHNHLFWPELRVLLVRIVDGAKEISSRAAMEQTRISSPYYESWVTDAQGVCADAIAALAARDLERLGHNMRKSYLRMFATMFAADPPILYWKPESLAVIKLCETLRKQGIAAWETMDAGPQVKIITTAADQEKILSALQNSLGLTQVFVDKAGPGPSILHNGVSVGAIHPLLLERATGLGLDLASVEPERGTY